MNEKKMPRITLGKNRISGLLSWLLILALVCSLITVSPAKVYAEIVASGECGTNVIWELTSNGTDTYKLTLKAKGDNAVTDNYSGPTSSKGTPWKDYITKITEF